MPHVYAGGIYLQASGHEFWRARLIAHAHD
jgi:hypothetical protein